MKKNLRIIFYCCMQLLLANSTVFANQNFSFDLVSASKNNSASVIASGPLQFCKGGSVTLTASNGDSYLWNTGETSQSILVTESGSYQVTITTGGVDEISAIITVQVSDNFPLVINAPANIVISTDPLSNVATNVQLGTPLIGTYCTETTISNNAPLSFPIGITNVVWTILDAAGNSASAVQTVQVVDTEKPRISRIGKISVVNDPGQCGAIVKLITPRAVDNSGAPVVFTNNAPVFFSVGSLRIIWTGTDMYGNSDTTSQLITVIDNELPVITVADIKVNNDPGKCGATVNLGIPITSDNCGVASVTNDAPLFFQTGTTLVNWVVKDKNGFSNTAIQTVVVTDIEAPVFVATPASISVTCSELASLAPPTATDNCDNNPLVSYVQTSTQSTNPSLKSYYNYVINRVWKATDINGNSSSASQVITVVDNVAPSLIVPANIVVSNSPDICGAVVNYVVTATDNCSSKVTITYSKKSGTEFPVGTTTVTVTAVDIAGNKVSKSFTVTVADTQRPLITAPKDILATVNTINSKINNLNLGTPIASDNCGVRTVSNNAPASYPVGVTTVVWTVRDVNGNLATATQIVTVAVVSNSSAKKTAGIQSNGTSISMVTEKMESPIADIEVKVAPNPSVNEFTVMLSSNTSTPFELRVVNILGNVVDARTKLLPNNSYKIGENYLPGLYFAELIQGNHRKTVQLLKLR